jgi:DNA-binding MarR family transcriptional regulator
MTLDLEPHVEESLILTLYDLVNHMTKKGESLALRADLTVQQWLVLLQIAGDPNFPKRPGEDERRGAGVLASEIASSRGVSRANVSALVSALIRRKLVRQVEDTADRRRKELRITARGKAVLEEIEPVRRRVNSALFRDLDPQEMAATLHFLRKVLATIRRSAGSLMPDHAPRPTSVRR